MGINQTESDRLVMHKLAPHRDPSWRCAVWQLATTLVGFAVCWAGMLWCYRSGWCWLAVCLLPLTAAFLVRLFILQHQYVDAYWRSHSQWDYVAAALSGSSYYRLPKVLPWFTANIGLHHIHHLDSRIPNYRLQRCVDEHPDLRVGRMLSLWESWFCLSMRLWDEQKGQMVGFPRRV